MSGGERRVADADRVGDVYAGGAFEGCADRIDELGRLIRAGIITSREQELKVLEALSDYFDDDRAGDDVDLLVAYARGSIGATAGDPLGGDRALLDRFDRSIRSILSFPVAQAELRCELDRIRPAVQKNDPSGLATLRDLCAHGRRDRPRLYMYRSNVIETLAVAAEMGAFSALVDAVHPRYHSEGQIGAPDFCQGDPRRAAFDHLVDLASRCNELAEEAREALVGLSSFISTAGPAVVRLPAHLLSDEQRGTLFKNLEWWEDLLGEDPILVPAEGAERVPDAIRSVLWLANDARRLA